MGILNLTPDSFSDGGKYNHTGKAKIHIKDMVKSGAKIIDVGGESTRPGSITVPDKIEWRRIKSIVRSFKRNYKNICLSVDTRKVDVMINSIKYKADIINDVSGFNYDISALKRLKAYKISKKVLHHMQGTPNTMQKILIIKMYY